MKELPCQEGSCEGIDGVASFLRIGGLRVEGRLRTLPGRWRDVSAEAAPPPSTAV